MLLHLLVKREVEQFYIARRAGVKSAVYCNRYIVIDNNQVHSHEELVISSCLWRKAAVGSNLNQQSVKKSIDQ
jgi:hypothetical protein